MLFFFFHQLSSCTFWVTEVKTEVLPLVVSSLSSQDRCPDTFQLSGKAVPLLIKNRRGRAGMEHYEPVRTPAKKSLQVPMLLLSRWHHFSPVMGQPPFDHSNVSLI